MASTQFAIIEATKNGNNLKVAIGLLRNTERG